MIISQIKSVPDDEWVYFIGAHPEEELPGAKWIDTDNGPRLVVPIIKEAETAVVEEEKEDDKKKKKK